MLFLVLCWLQVLFPATLLYGSFLDLPSFLIHICWLAPRRRLERIFRLPEFSLCKAFYSLLACFGTPELPWPPPRDSFIIITQWEQHSSPMCPLPFATVLGNVSNQELNWALVMGNFWYSFSGLIHFPRACIDRINSNVGLLQYLTDQYLWHLLYRKEEWLWIKHLLKKFLKRNEHHRFQKRRKKYITLKPNVCFNWNNPNKN